MIGAFHVPGLSDEDAPGTVAETAPDAGPSSPVVTSLVPYAFAQLDPGSGYPAGIRAPRWRQAVLDAGGDPGRVRAAAARFLTEVCREIRASGDTAGTGEAVEALRLAGDLGTLRGLPVPGRRELVEAVTSVLGRGQALDRELGAVLVGTGRGRLAPGTPAPASDHGWRPNWPRCGCPARPTRAAGTSGSRRCAPRSTPGARSCSSA